MLSYERIRQGSSILITVVVCFISLALFAQSLFSLYLMLYSWEHPERVQASRGPRSFLAPHYSFTVLLPARHEKAVIYETTKRVWAANYPSHLLEIAVICHADDTDTIAEAQRAIDDIGSLRIRVETFSNLPINKPHGLNVGLRRTQNQVVTIFDAEDDIHPNIFNVVNTVMLQEKVGIVQAGVQLMNFADHWFAAHNCMEYFFWFKSRLHFHAKVGMIPLGGNTVFICRNLLERVGGWDEHCLTEDADIGLRLSVLGEPIRVVYDAQHVTREETPENVASFIRQRTRWLQGYVQVLRRGVWLSLPQLRQRLLAFYTLSYPLFQAILLLLWPLTILTMLWVKVPVLAAMISFLPLYALLFQFVATAVGAFLFAKEYGLRFPLLKPLSMALTFLPFQWLLSVSAVRGVYRELRGQRNWEKTAHLGAHRQPEVGPSFGIEQILPAVLKPARPGVLFVLSRAPVALWRKVDALWSARFAQVRVRPATTLLPHGARMPVGIRSALISLALAALLVLCLNGSGLPSAARSIAQPSIHSHTSASHRGYRPIERSTSVAGKSNPASLASTYSGEMYNVALNLSTTMFLMSIQQNRKSIHGYFLDEQAHGVRVQEPFRGIVDGWDQVQFTVVEDKEHITLSFKGLIQPDGTLGGDYCSLNPERQCAGERGEYGVWSAIPTSGGGSQ
jgi:cellulose synthase/poly-beta-1,6-N-acetylglucosamine synthase-like glycosyltransferase